MWSFIMFCETDETVVHGSYLQSNRLGNVDYRYSLSELNQIFVEMSGVFTTRDVGYYQWCKVFQ